MRLETSLASDKYLTMSRAGESSPVMFHGNEMIIYVGEWNVVVIPITPEQKEDLRNAFDPKRMAQEWKDAEEGGYL